MRAKSLNRIRLFVTQWTAARQAPPSLGFSRQEHWSGLPFHSLMPIILYSSFYFKPDSSAGMCVCVREREAGMGREEVGETEGAGGERVTNENLKRQASFHL